MISYHGSTLRHIRVKLNVGKSGICGAAMDRNTFGRHVYYRVYVYKRAS